MVILILDISRVPRWYINKDILKSCWAFFVWATIFIPIFQKNGEWKVLYKINSSPVITPFLCNIGRKNPLETLEYYFERKSITFFNNTLIQSKRLCFCERMCIDMLRQQIFSLFSSSILHHFLYWWMKMLTSMSLNNSVSESLGAKNFGYFWWDDQRIISKGKMIEMS